VRALLSSHRWRRRLAWAAGCLLTAAILVAIGIKYPNTADSQETPISKAPPVVDVEPTPVTLTPAAKQAALATAANFIKTAVLRRRLDASWTLTAPELRQGYTKKQWRTGEIPVVPYPAGQLGSARSRLSYSYADVVGLQVLLIPKRKSTLREMEFLMELRAVGSHKRKHWLVTSWGPSGSASPAPAAAPRGADEPIKQASLSASWLLVPAGIFVILLLVPLTLVLRHWRQGRRAERAYREAARMREMSAASSRRPLG
jgi:hypothetical protein